MHADGRDCLQPQEDAGVQGCQADGRAGSVGKAQRMAVTKPLFFFQFNLLPYFIWRKSQISACRLSYQQVFPHNGN